MSKNAGTEVRAGQLHAKVLEVLHKMTDPITIEMADGEVEEVYDKDWFKMGLVFLKENKISVVETVDSLSGDLRNKLQTKNTPVFKSNVTPLFVQESDVNKGTGI